MEKTGHGRYLQRTYFDVVPRTKKLVALLDALGMSYRDALLSLTTTPYWLTFSALVADGGFGLRDEGLPNIATYQVSGYAPVRLGERLGISRSARVRLETRFCPQCLAEDLLKFGEVYWHRAHHLPNVHFCVHHLCALVGACPQCGDSTVAAVKQMMPLPNVICPCGMDLRTLKTSIVSAPAIRRVMALSVGALNSEVPTWDVYQVKAYLDRVSEPIRKSGKGRSQIFRETFKFFKREGSELNRTAVEMRSSESDDYRNLRFRLSGAFPSGAKEAVGLLAALDIPLDVATQGFRNEVVHESATEKPLKFHQLIKNKAARRARAQALIAQGWKRLRANQPFYQYLCLYDREWLLSQGGAPRNLPSVERDRAKLLCMVQKLEERHGATTKALDQLRCNCISIRASYRDKEWLEELIGKFKKKVIEIKSCSEEELLKRQSAQLHAIVEKKTLHVTRPECLTLAMLARLASMSPLQLKRVCEYDRSLEAAIKRHNSERIERHIHWAIRELTAAQKPLGVSAIAAKARVRLTPENSELVKRCLGVLPGRK